jgi:hypothetical protein
MDMVTSEQHFLSHCHVYFVDRKSGEEGWLDEKWEFLTKEVLLSCELQVY